jgi:hypothetical protein
LSPRSPSARESIHFDSSRSRYCCAARSIKRREARDRALLRALMHLSSSAIIVESHSRVPA